MKVPEVLLSGNHAEIAKWRRRTGAAADGGTAAGFVVTAGDETPGKKKFMNQALLDKIESEQYRKNT